MFSPDAGPRACAGALFLLWGFLAAAAHAGDEVPRQGHPVGDAYVAARQIHVFPDGRGLPPGQGSVAEGRALFVKKCAACHGAYGEGGTAPELAHADEPLTSPDASKTIGSYWPYATTLFDFVRRAMPPDAPRSLDDSQVYALAAWLLHENGLISEDAVMNRETLPEVVMPNRHGFARIDAPR